MYEQEKIESGLAKYKHIIKFCTTHSSVESNWPNTQTRRYTYVSSGAGVHVRLRNCVC